MCEETKFKFLEEMELSWVTNGWDLVVSISHMGIEGISALSCGCCIGDTCCCAHKHIISCAVAYFNNFEGIFGLRMLSRSCEDVFGWMHVVC